MSRGVTTPRPGNNLGAIWSAFDAIHAIRYGPDWHTNVVTPETGVLNDIAKNRLAQVTWVVPNATNSDHAYPAGRTIACGRDRNK